MRVVLSLAFVLAVFASSACQPDLGTCDVVAAKRKVYTDEGTPYYEGQALVTRSCSGGLCHAGTATAMTRYGAPHGLDFDLDPIGPMSTPQQLALLNAGMAKVREEAADMYGEISAGTMPPGAIGATRTTGSWRMLNGTTPVDVVLPSIQTPQGKEIARNWLACGAPTIVGLGASADMGATANETPIAAKQIVATAGFGPVYSLLKEKCSVCHSAGSVFPSIDLSTQAMAHATLVNKDPATSSTSKCAGKNKLVIPGDCKNSLLYLKMQAKPVVCGDPMPQGSDMPLPEASRQAVCDWIMAGAAP